MTILSAGSMDTQGNFQAPCQAARRRNSQALSIGWFQKIDGCPISGRAAMAEYWAARLASMQPATPAAVLPVAAFSLEVRDEGDRSLEFGDEGDRPVDLAHAGELLGRR